MQGLLDRIHRLETQLDAEVEAHLTERAEAAEAEAQAKANRLLSESITPTLGQYEMSKRWNGQMPQVSGAAMPSIPTPKHRGSPCRCAPMPPATSP